MIPDFKTVEERSQWIIHHADLFTAVRFHGYGKYERHEFTDRQTAETTARRLANESGGRYLISACAGIYDTWIKSIYPKEK